MGTLQARRARGQTGQVGRGGHPNLDQDGEECSAGSEAYRNDLCHEFDVVGVAY